MIVGVCVRRAAGMRAGALTLSQAIEAALAANPANGGARVPRARRPSSRLPQARAGFLPRVDFTQSWQRGNQPVFVFGSLLAQRQFAEADFALGQLNNPRAADQFAQRVVGRTDGVRRRTHASRGADRARSRRPTAQAGERQTRNDLALAATRAYGQVAARGGGRRAAESAVTAAEEDVRTAEARRDAGTGTEADVLSMRVHLAQMRARAIDAASGERIARGELNRLMNAPLDRDWSLDEPARRCAFAGGRRRR